MSLETANFITELDVNNPTGADFQNQGDNHMRQLKSVLQNNFPNASRAWYLPTTTAAVGGDLSLATTDQNKVIPFNTNGASRTVTLPAMSSGFDGWEVTVFKSDGSTNTLIIDGNGSDTINGANTQVLTVQYEAMRCIWCNTLGQWLGIRSVIPNSVLASILALSSATGGVGVLKKTAVDTWALDVGTTNINFAKSGGGIALTTGIMGEQNIDFACKIRGVKLLADASGSCTVTISKAAFAGYAGSLASIVASAKPTLSSAISSNDTTLSGWTTTLAAGDVLRYTLDTTATITRLLVSLKVDRYF